MKALHVRSGRELRLAKPTQFMAQERTIIDEAFAGDVIGIHDPGVFEHRRHADHRRRRALRGHPALLA
jgi:peptide subunit release factor RF-3